MSRRDSIPHLHNPVKKVYYQETWGAPNPSAGIRAMEWELQSIIKVLRVMKTNSTGDLPLSFLFSSLGKEENGSEKNKVWIL